MNLNRRDAKTFVERVCTAAAERYGSAKSSGGKKEEIQARCVCLSLADMQLVFDLIVHDYTYYTRKFAKLSNSVMRVSVYAKGDMLFPAEGETAGGKEDRYFIFPELSVQPSFKFECPVKLPLIFDPCRQY